MVIAMQKKKVMNCAAIERCRVEQGKKRLTQLIAINSLVGER